MSDKLASFMYENVQYFVVLDGGYLQNEFSGRNAVTFSDFMGDPGYVIAFARPWGKTRVQGCPVSEDALITKKGDNFVGYGTCGDIKFELHEDKYIATPVEETTPEEVKNVIDDLVENGRSSSKQSMLDAAMESIPEEKEAALNVVPLTVTVDDGKVTEVVEGIEGEVATAEEKEKLVSMLTTQSDVRTFVGGYTTAFCRFGGSIVRRDRTPKGLIINQDVRTASTRRGIELLGRKPVTSPIRSPEVEEEPEQFGVVGEMPLPNVVSEIPETTVHAPIPEPEPVMHIPTNKLFSNAPKMQKDSFDSDAFLSELSEDQQEVLRSIPSALTGKLAKYIMKPIDVEKLSHEGAEYCVNNKWEMAGEWYAIDSLADLSRYFYCESTGQYYVIPSKTLKGWLKCQELSQVV